MSLFGMIPREEYQRSPLFRLAEIMGESYDLDTDPQWEDTLTSQTFPELLEGLCPFYGALTEEQGRAALDVWYRLEGTVDEPLPDVLILDVLYG